MALSARELRLQILPDRFGGGIVLRARVLPAAYLLLGINLLLCASRLSRGWWWQDDLNLLARAADRPLTGLLLSDYNGHLVPGTWVLAWLFDHLAPLQWWPAAVVTIALVAAVDLAMLALLRRLFGTRPAILIPFAMTCATSLTLTSTLWWAASLQWLPVTLSLALGLWFHLGFWESGKVRDAAGAVGSVVLGLAFFEKGLTTLLVLAVFAVLYGVTGPLWRRPGRALLAHPAYWVAHAAVAGGFLGLYLARVNVDTGPTPASSDVFAAIRWMILDTLLPSLIGGPLNWYTTPDTTINAWAHPIPVIAITAWVLTAGAIVGSLATKRGAWRAWVLLAIFLTVSVGLVVRARLGFIGPFIGRDHRYLTDAAVLAPLGLALAWMRLQPGLDASSVQDPLDDADSLDDADLLDDVELPSADADSDVGPAVADEEPVNLFEPAQQRIAREQAAAASRSKTSVPVTAGSALAKRPAAVPGPPTTGYAGELLVEQALEDAAKRGIRATGDLTRRFSRNQQARSIVAAVAVVLITLGGAVSGERFMTSWSANPTKPYLDNLMAGIDTAATAGTPLNLLPEATVPDLIMTPTFEADRRLSHITRPLRRRPNFPAYADSYSLVDGLGVVHPADVPAATGMIATGVSGESCAKPGQSARLTFPLPQAAWRWVVKLDYLAQSNTGATLSLGAYPGVPILLTKGLNTVYVDLLGGASSTLVLNGVGAGSSVCIGKATIGNLTAIG